MVCLFIWLHYNPSCQFRSYRGCKGFGYDPIFLLARLGTTEKNQLSHRARAVKAALPGLVRMVG